MLGNKSIDGRKRFSIGFFIFHEVNRCINGLFHTNSERAFLEKNVYKFQIVVYSKF